MSLRYRAGLHTCLKGIQRLRPASRTLSSAAMFDCLTGVSGALFPIPIVSTILTWR